MLGIRQAPLRAVVDTLTVTATGVALVNVWVDGWTEHVTVAGAPEQESVTVSRLPEAGVNVSPYCAAFPAVTDWLVDEPAAGVNRNSVPDPEREIDCGLLIPSSVMSMRVWLLPDDEGV